MTLAIVMIVMAPGTHHHVPRDGVPQDGVSASA